MTNNGRYISEANHAFSIKGDSDELLEAAKEAVKVKDKIILKEILGEMLDRQRNRGVKKKPVNKKLNSYILAVEEYMEMINS